jgi:copper(I)-binding protein
VSRRHLTVAVAVLSAAVLSACGTGFQAQTYRETGRQDAASTDLDSIAVRNLHVQAPTSGRTLASGGQAVLTGTFVNTGDTADSLLSITTDVASSVTLMIDGRQVTEVPIPARGTSPAWTAVLDGLTKDLHAGDYVSVTLSFARAGRTTLQAPVRAGNNGLGERPPAQDPYGEH